jgi:ketosteroid isomerase-like protein
MKKFIYALALAIMVFSVNSEAASQRSSESTTSGVWQHHISSWNSRDSEAIVSDYSETSTLIINGEVFHGREEIKSAFEQLFRIFDQGENVIDPAVIDGEVIYLTWHFSPVNEASFDGSDTFMVQNGKIVIQTIASRLYVRFPVTKWMR